MKHATKCILANAIALAFSASAICQAQPLSDRCWAKSHERADAIERCSNEIRKHASKAAALPELYAGRGFAYAVSGNYAAAIADYNKALTLRTDSWEIYFGRAIAWAQSGSMGRATDDFSSAVRLNPRLLKSIDKRAAELEALGGKDEADLERAYTLSLLLQLTCRDRPVAKQVCAGEFVGGPTKPTEGPCMVCGPQAHLAPLHN